MQDGVEVIITKYESLCQPLQLQPHSEEAFKQWQSQMQRQLAQAMQVMPTE
jgi:hypothetical protein